MKLKEVTLPSGIIVPKKGFWLHESCPKAEEHSHVPADFNSVYGSQTHKQIKHEVCGLWTQWVKKESRYEL